MSDNAGISVKKHRSVWQKELKVNPKSLLVTLAKAGANVAFLQWDDLAENGAELLDSLGLEATSGEIAGLLIIRALQRAIQELIKSNRDLFQGEPNNLRELYQNLENALDDSEFTINQEFFLRPKICLLSKALRRGFCSG